jgi:hypothetical protein
VPINNYVKESIMSKEAIEFKVANPRGVIEPKRNYPLSPRIKDLAGKKIALVTNQKQGARTFLDAVQEHLRAKYPTTTFVTQYDASINLAKEPEFYQEVARSADAFIFGSGD